MHTSGDETFPFLELLLMPLLLELMSISSLALGVSGPDLHSPKKHAALEIPARSLCSGFMVPAPLMTHVSRKRRGSLVSSSCLLLDQSWQKYLHRAHASVLCNIALSNKNAAESDSVSNRSENHQDAQVEQASVARQIAGRPRLSVYLVLLSHCAVAALHLCWKSVSTLISMATDDTQAALLVAPMPGLEVHLYSITSHDAQRVMKQPSSGTNRKVSNNLTILGGADEWARQPRAEGTAEECRGDRQHG